MNEKIKKTHLSTATHVGGKSHFANYVTNQSNNIDCYLPITHVTDAYDFRDIAESNTLLPKNCAVHNNKLLYFFYGRPAYRKNGYVQANNLTAYAPIVLIFDPTLIEKASLVYPFDSGAFAEKYGEFTHHQMKIQDFQMSASLENVGKLISLFYGNSRNYYDQIPENDKKVPASEFEVQTFVEIISFKGKNDKDDRSSTIEIVFDQALEFRDGLLGIVIPQSLLMDKAFKSKISTFGSQIIPYADGASLTPSSQIPRLQDIVRSFYMKKKIIK